MGSAYPNRIAKHAQVKIFAKKKVESLIDFHYTYFAYLSLLS